VYAALRGSGMLAGLLEHGYRYVLIANADNLGSTVDAGSPPIWPASRSRF